MAQATAHCLVANSRKGAKESKYESRTQSRVDSIKRSREWHECISSLHIQIPSRNIFNSIATLRDCAFALLATPTHDGADSSKKWVFTWLCNDFYTAQCLPTFPAVKQRYKCICRMHVCRFWRKTAKHLVKIQIQHASNNYMHICISLSVSYICISVSGYRAIRKIHLYLCLWLSNRR